MSAGKTGSLIAWVVSLMLLWGCTEMTNYGNYAPDAEVTRLFESGAQSAQYDYYFAGPESGPTAILGVKKDYVLEERYWQRIDSNSDAYGKRLEDMRNRTLRLGFFLKGYALYGLHREPVGIWYSVFQATPVIRFIGGTRIEIIPPPSDLYERGG